MSGRLAVVTVVHGRHQHLARQQRLLTSGDRRPDDWVVVAMADSEVRRRLPPTGVVPRVVELDADPAALPLAAARNRGATEVLTRGADVLVFLDVDCLPAPSLLSAYADAVEGEPSTIWSGPVTYLPPGLDDGVLSRPWLLDDPHPGRPAPAPGVLERGAPPELFWSLSFALSSGAWERVGGFDEEYVGYGAEDTDFAFSAAQHGVGLGWVGSARAYHQHHPTHDPPVQHVSAIVQNSRRFRRRWGRWPMEGWLQAFEVMGLVQRHGDGIRLLGEPGTASVPLDPRVPGPGGP